MVPSDNAVSNGGYYITQQQLQLERAREIEQRLMTELKQLTEEKEKLIKEKEQVCSLLDTMHMYSSVTAAVAGNRIYHL